MPTGGFVFPRCAPLDNDCLSTIEQNDELLDDKDKIINAHKKYYISAGYITNDESDENTVLLSILTTSSNHNEEIDTWKEQSLGNWYSFKIHYELRWKSICLHPDSIPK